MRAFGSDSILVKDKQTGIEYQDEEVVMLNFDNGEIIVRNDWSDEKLLYMEDCEILIEM